jgi:hypothetical protein
MEKIQINISASKLAALIGCNPYESTFQAYVKLFSRKKQLLLQLGTVVELTDEQKLAKYVSENKFKCNLWQFKKCKTTGDLDKLEEKITIQNKVTDEDKKKEFKLLIDKVVRKRFGTRHEKNVRNTVNLTRKDKIVKDEKYYKKHLFETEKFTFYLVGKVDGADSAGILYEIKTRRSRLFHTLRDYEKIQMYAYMFLANYKKACLIEEFKPTIDTVERDQQEIEFNRDFWQKITTRAKIACNIFEECFKQESDKHSKTQTTDGREEIDTYIASIMSKVAKL